MCGGIRLPQVIRWLHEAATKHGFPKAIDLGFGKQPGLLVDNPIRQFSAMVRDLSLAGNQESLSRNSRLSGFTGGRMNDFSQADQADGSAAVNAGEDGGEAVVVILRPAVERMIVAVGTPEANAEEHFTEILRFGASIRRTAMEVGRAVFPGITAGDEHLLGHLIERLPGLNLLANPVVKGVRPPLVIRPYSDPQLPGESPGPVVDERFRSKE